MQLATIFAGGCEDSANPRKLHLLNEATGKPYCGQVFQYHGRVNCDHIEADDFVGAEACSRCLKHIPRLIQN